MYTVSAKVPAKTKIKIAACDWEPYTGANLQSRGLLSAICIEALRRGGYESEVLIYPWARAVEETKNGTTQALLGAGYTEERSKYYAYPDEVWISNVGFFTVKEDGANRRFTSIEKLAPSVIGVLNGSQYVDDLEKVRGIKIEKAASVDINIKKVAFGRINYLIEDKTAVEYILNTKLPELKGRVVFINPSYRKTKLYIVFSKKNQNYKKLVHDFNYGLSSMKRDGTYEKIIKQFGLIR